jgi:deoxyribonuclease-4
MRLGFHVSVAGGVHHAVRAGVLRRCHTIQVFTAAPAVWARRKPHPEQDAAFANGCREADLWPVFIRAPYLLNVASADEDLWQKSVSVLIQELETANRWQAMGVVLHLGSSVGQTEQQGLKRVTRALAQVRDHSVGPAQIIMENCAGQGELIGHSMEQLGAIVEAVGTDRIGVCLDTAHAFAAGYGLHTAEGLDALLQEADELFGLDLLRLIHLNDSRSELGSRVDRHEHIGDGHIGPAGFRGILSEPRLHHLPFIMETPKGVKGELEDDLMNLRRVRRLIPKHLRPSLPPAVRAQKRG